jgi:peroxiredoxin
MSEPGAPAEPAAEGPVSSLAWTRYVALGLVVAMGLALILLGEGTPPPLVRGAKAPEFSLPPLGGGAPVVLSEQRGKTVLVNFWATWCKPCEDEMPAMERLYRRLKPQGFELLAVSVDEDEAEVEAFRERMGITFPILMDPKQNVSRAYQTMGFPESLLVGPDGVVVERYVGPRDWDHESFAQRIAALLR